jgi:hydrogenase maturation protein HypF
MYFLPDEIDYFCLPIITCSLQKKNNIKALLIQIKGLVQGVGFRPFIYRLAKGLQITGWVENRNDGVKIHAEGSSESLREFLLAIRREAPAASSIRTVSKAQALPGHFSSFNIRKSEDISQEITDISPDIAVCDACMEDLKTQPHRIGYPFINCTNCGPRFTIISDLPYDRPKTTMVVFPMCDLCQAEYDNILDRRFHAQPVACNHCGPKYEMIRHERTHTNIDDILIHASKDIKKGKIIAVKGLGGFHLACDAFNEEAVRKLRSRKNREGKPFAVMFRDITCAKEYLDINAIEQQSLLSWQRPILISRNKISPHQLAFSVSNGFHTTGAMLPYMPFHYLLFENLETPAIVLTSGNISDEPILIKNEQAKLSLQGIAGSFILHNRDILNRTDDSVAMVVNDKQRMVRRSRGFVPTPIETNLDTEGIFASGAELVNCFCIGKGKQALLSQHIGDLKNLETMDFYEEAFNRFKVMYRFEPGLFAVDLHPDYLSRRFCEEYINDHVNDGKAEWVEIQHHHAHAASCMTEHGLDEEVIGVTLDGVGYGTDGNIWGFEFMSCDLVDFTRELHPEYIAQPGGDLTTYEPWRMAVSYLYKVYGDELAGLSFPFLDMIEKEKIELIIQTIQKKINAPLTCSAGRLFDAVAAISGTCLQADFHAEAPMRLEQLIEGHENGSYPFAIGDQISTDGIIKGIVDDLISKVDTSIISTRFHNTIIEIITQGTDLIRAKRGIETVVLSGGTFQNRYILSGAEDALAKMGFKVYSHENVPTNDGGIALGQLAIAAKRRSIGFI